MTTDRRACLRHLDGLLALVLATAAMLLSPARASADAPGFDRLTPPEWPTYDIAVFFDAKRADRAGVVTTESGLKYVMLDEGDTSQPTPRLSDEVAIWQRNASGSGREWTWDEEFVRSDGVVDDYIGYYEEGLQLMHPGARFVFWIPGKNERFIETAMIGIEKSSFDDGDAAADCSCGSDDEEEEDAAPAFDETGFFLQNARFRGVIPLGVGLHCKVLKEGRGRKIGPDDEVWVSYSVTPLRDHASFEPGRGEFTRAEGRVGTYIRGIQRGLQTMREGSRCIFWLGADWSGSVKPAIWEVEVLGVWRAGRDASR